MSHIGGFFELEPDGSGWGSLHSDALALHTGRACLTEMLSVLTPRRIFVPYYTCDATLAPFREKLVETVFYALDEFLRPLGLPVLKNGDYLLYTNYFGLCETHIEGLAGQFGPQLLVDDTHAFFRGRRTGLWSFTSARKYFGVPDGAYLYAPITFSHKMPPAFEGDSLLHLQLRQAGRQEEAFVAYQQYEQSLDTRVFGISARSQALLSRVNYLAVAEARRRNYQTLHRRLVKTNELKLPLGDAVPFCYPYLPKQPIAHQQLYQKKIYPPKLWADVLSRSSTDSAPEWELSLVENLLPLPVDHRYGEHAMHTILDALGAS